MIAAVFIVATLIILVLGALVVRAQQRDEPGYEEMDPDLDLRRYQAEQRLEARRLKYRIRRDGVDLRRELHRDLFEQRDPDE